MRPFRSTTQQYSASATESNLEAFGALMKQVLAIIIVLILSSTSKSFLDDAWHVPFVFIVLTLSSTSKSFLDVACPVRLHPTNDTPLKSASSFFPIPTMIFSNS